MLEGRRYHGTLVPEIRNFEVMGGERSQTRFLREVALAVAARRFERRDKALRFSGALGGDFHYEIVEQDEARGRRKSGG